MGFDNDLKVVCFCDNKSIVDNLHSTHIVSDFRLRIDVVVVKDMMCRKELNKVMWIEAKNQLADCVTKLQPAKTATTARSVEICQADDKNRITQSLSCVSVWHVGTLVPLAL